MRNPEKLIIPIIVIMLITVLGCYLIINEYNDRNVQIKRGITEDKPDGESSDETVVSEGDLKYETTAVLIRVDKEKGMLTFRTIDGDDDFSLGYDSKIKVYSKRGKTMLLEQIALGEILNVIYSVHSNMVDTIQVSDKAWSQTGVTKFSINAKSRTMEVADRMYRMEDSVVVSYGNKLANLIDVTSVDTLVVKGVDTKVCSVIVEKGHGYLRLLNDAYFLGGWLEVGQEIIKPISERMLLPVPEGEYRVRVTNRGYAGEETITIERDKETEVDLSKIEIKEVAIGHVLFNIEPDYAQLHIDGEMTDFEERVPLEYGVHSIHVESAGYESVDTNIKITSEYADVTITLDEKKDGDSSSSSSTSSSREYSMGDISTSSSSSSSSSSTSSSSSSSSSSSRRTSSSAGTHNQNTPTLPTSSRTFVPPHNTSTSSPIGQSSSSESSSSSSSSSSSAIVIGDGNSIYIDSPEGAMVYIDGAYVGTAPCSCPKVTGTHIITFAKDGFVTKSYTENIDDDGNDVTLSYSELTSAQELQDEVTNTLQEQLNEMMNQLTE